MDRQLGAGVTQQHGVGCGGVGALTALRGVPDKVVFAVGVFGVCYGLFNGLAEDEVVDRIPPPARMELPIEGSMASSTPRNSQVSE